MRLPRHPGLLERTFTVLALLLTTDAVLALVQAGSSSSDATLASSSGDPVKQAVFAAIYAISGALLIWRHGVIAPLRHGALAWIILGCAAASTLWSVNPELTVRRVVALAGTSLLGIYIGSTYRGDRLVRIIAAAMVLAIVGSIVWAIALPDLAFQLDARGTALNGVYRHKNGLGQYMAWSLFVAVLMHRISPTRLRRRMWKLVLVAALGLLVASTSKTALVAAGILLALLPARAMVNWARAQTASLLAGLAAWVSAATIATGIVVAANFSAITIALGRDPTLTGRIHIWSAVIDAIRIHPWLGYGYSAFWGDASSPASDIWAKTGPLLWGLRVTHAHNGWLDLWLQVGAVGVALYATVLLLLAAWALGRALRPQASAAALLAGGFLVFFITYNTVESRTLEQNSFFWVMMCALVAARSIERAERRATQPTRRGSARTRGSAGRPGPRTPHSRTRSSAAHRALDGGA